MQCKEYFDANSELFKEKHCMKIHVKSNSVI